MLICFYLSDIANQIVSNCSRVVCLCICVCICLSTFILLHAGVHKLSPSVGPVLNLNCTMVSFCVLPNIGEMNFI